jgi:hypothetical protein
VFAHVGERVGQLGRAKRAGSDPHLPLLALAVVRRSFPRSQVALGNALVGEAVLPSG